MNKKIRTKKEIEQDMRRIFDDKPEKEIVKGILEYIDNLNGKEIIPKDGIMSLIFAEIASSDFTKGTILFTNKSLRKLFPELRNRDEYIELVTSCIQGYAKVLSSNKSDFLILGDRLQHYLFLYDLIYTCPRFEKYLKERIKIEELVAIISKEERSIKLIHQLVKNNKDVSVLLNEFAFLFRQKLVVDLIIRKIVPLNSIFIYYDIDKDIKENTEHLYIVLNKKIPRNTIQTTIRDNLEKIKKGNFSVPEL